MYRLIIGVLSFYVSFSCQSVIAAESYSVNSAMYADSSFEDELYQFTPYDKIYLVLDFFNLSAGQYNLSVDWITPFGSLERQTTHSFTIDETVPSYRVYFWLKLRRRGPLKRTLTGLDYKEEFYGEWRAKYHFNALSIGSKTFKVH